MVRLLYHKLTEGEKISKGKINPIDPMRSHAATEILPKTHDREMEKEAEAEGERKKKREGYRRIERKKGEGYRGREEEGVKKGEEEEREREGEIGRIKRGTDLKEKKKKYLRHHIQNHKPIR